MSLFIPLSVEGARQGECSSMGTGTVQSVLPEPHAWCSTHVVPSNSVCVLVELEQSASACVWVLVEVSYVGCFQLLYRVDGGGCC